MLNRSRDASLILLVAVALATHAWGQVVGASISGTVRDATGAGLPEVAVTIRNVETGALRKLVSDENGRYAARSIAVGPYEVRAEKEGFSAQVKT
jgi:hypothetical protein